MDQPRALRQPPALRAASAGFLALWCLVAAFPILWIMVMSFKAPIDAFAQNPLVVIFGPGTRALGRGISIPDILAGIALAWLAWRALGRWLPRLALAFPPGLAWLGWCSGFLAWCLGAGLAFLVALPAVMGPVNSLLGPAGANVIGLTLEHYETIWLERGFLNNFKNSLVVTTGVVAISLTVGTLAGYGLARTRAGAAIAFGLLLLALVFRALPHSVLVAGYLPVFIGSAEILRPILGDAAPTLYGKPAAVIVVLVAINQPFTIWMLHSFFRNIPPELDEAARVDGCSHFEAFRRVIIPVMWPGVITTGLFSFLLGYNDFLVTSLLLDAQNQTMVPAIAGMFNRETTATDQVEAVAAAVSITAPLLVLVMVFQRQIVSGLTAGAVKG